MGRGFSYHRGSRAPHHPPSITDRLTGLPDRYALQQQSTGDREQTLLVAEVLGLGRLNATYGFDFGDRLLQQAAAWLSRCKPSGAQLYRLGGASFGLLFETVSEAYVCDVAETLWAAAYEQSIEVEGVRLYLPLVFGVASTGAEALICCAHSALEAAKGSSQKVGLYSPECSALQAQHHNILWGQRVRQALEEEAIVPVYQPIVHNRSNTIERYECLARLGRGALQHGPATFLEPARKAGLLPGITYAMINHSFQQLGPTGYGMSLNLSSEDLRNEALAGYLLHRCARYGVTPGRVTLEILEDVAWAPGTTKAINRLKEAGFQIALDDFGCEMANFSRLLELEVDSIKIDGAFVRRIATSRRHRAVVEAIARFAHTIGASSMAEFVHDEMTHRIICDLGVDYAQGYYIGPPEAAPVRAQA